jgi:IS30 family transposase
LLRQYLPKSSDINTFSQADLNAIADKLNTRPRKKIDFHTPEEVYFAAALCKIKTIGGALHVRFRRL